MNKQCEVLAPAGSVEAVLPMIEAGADAIYVGLKGFSSRPSRSDMTLAEVGEALSICRAHNVHLYVAVNVSVSQSDLPQVMEAIWQLDEMQVDAVILAELGLALYFAKRLKHAVVHASTLLGVYNAKTVGLLKEAGVTRIIFYANLYFDEMNAIISAHPDLEYELVAEGGTCFNDIRQCRLPHRMDNGKHELSCRDRYLLYSPGREPEVAKPLCEYATQAAELISAYVGIGVTSFKIEGRTEPMENRLPMVKRLVAERDRMRQMEFPKGSLHYLARDRREMW